MSEIFNVPNPIDSVATPRTKENAFHATKPVNIRQPKNFKRALKRLNETGQLSLDDFNSAADVGAFIDFYNETIRKKNEDYAVNEIVEISKLLARLQTQKHIMIKKPKNDKIEV